MKKSFIFCMLIMNLLLQAQEKPTLFLIGDSTMSDKKDPEKNPEHGWGQMLPELMTSDITIENHAVNGRSTRSFIAEERWETVKNKLKPGDFVFIQFGHNDQKIEDAERYTNPFTQYRANLVRFVSETKEKGAQPILLSSIVRRNFNEAGVLVDTHGEYPLVTRMVAENLEVPFIDMQLLTEQLEMTYGRENSKTLHLHIEPGENAYKPEGVEDNTHLSKKGATLVASLALQNIINKDLELKKYIKKEALETIPTSEPDKLSWREVQHKSREWYASNEAKEIADNVLLYQHKNGGWLKNINMAKELSKQEMETLEKEKSQKIGTTIDNGATHTQLAYLAKVYAATGDKKYEDAFLRGIDFLLEAQYKNGGWPQFYPIKNGYYEHITFNDGAMIGVMELLRDISKGNYPYDFVKAPLQKKATKAIDKGLEIILAAQVKVNGELTIWCAQHDKDDLSPAKARAYELPSLSGKESTDIVEYLLKLENPSAEVKQSIRSAVKWFEENKVMGKKVVWIKDPEVPGSRDRILVEDPDGGPLWGRFNEIETGKPTFVGRDGVVKYHLNEIEKERRTGYNYIDDYAKDLINNKYPEWEKKH